MFFIRLLKLIAIGLFSVAVLFPFLSSDKDTVESIDLTEEKPISKPITVPVSTSGNPDFASITDVEEKKRTFFSFLKPKLDLENNRIEQERIKLISISQSIENQEVSHEEKQYAQHIADLYNYPEFKDNSDWIKGLLKRVNVIPDALVYVQAAMESGWGTSRFALEGNNFFGQWCYSEGCGLVPQSRVSGATHEVAKFKTVQDSVHAYFMNLNRNRAYTELRDMRDEQLTQSPEHLRSDGVAIELTNGLLRYSERGSDYVDELQAMININSKYWN